MGIYYVINAINEQGAVDHAADQSTYWYTCKRDAVQFCP